MRVVNAGIYLGVGHGESRTPITSLRVGTDRHEILAEVQWTEAKEADDYPNLGTLALLVGPDGASVVLGGGAVGGHAATLTNFATLQGVDLPEPGAYQVEIRSAVLLDPAGGPVRDAGPGDRRLAVLPLEVLSEGD